MDAKGITSNKVATVPNLQGVSKKFKTGSRSVSEDLSSGKEHSEKSEHLHEHLGLRVAFESTLWICCRYRLMQDLDILSQAAS